jgi:hypothetical protein
MLAKRKLPHPLALDYAARTVGHEWLHTNGRPADSPELELRHRVGVIRAAHDERVVLASQGDF